MINHTHCLAVSIPRKLLMASKVCEHSKTSQTGSEPGHLKDKKCCTVTKCLNKHKEVIQQSLILARPKCRCHQLYSPRYSKNGMKLCQMFNHTSPVQRAKHFVPATCHAKMSRKKCHPLASSYLVQRSYCRPQRIYTRSMTENAISSYLSVNLVERIKTFTS